MDELSLDAHFKFGENWEKLLPHIDEARVAMAVEDIAAFMGRASLAGQSFLDIGCGSGLSSLAAYRLGATSITSVDIDPLNVRNVETLKRKFGVLHDHDWRAYVCSIVGPAAMDLPKADIVYAWGVLHHTGAMWMAIDNCAHLVKPRGFLYVMLYRDAYLAPVWRAIKRTYTRGGPFLKWTLRNGYAGFQIAALLAKGRNPWRIIRDYAKTRGMSWYIDSTDWIGGYPFEYTNAERVIDRLTPQGFQLVKLFPAPHPKPVGWQGTGSYQYLFQRRP